MTLSYWFRIVLLLGVAALLPAGCGGYLPPLPGWHSPAPAATASPSAPRPAAPQEAQKPHLFPERPLTLLMGAPRGAGSDVAARLLTPRLEQLVGQPVVVVNRPEGDGLEAWTQLKQAKPDGYTLGALTSPQIHAMALDPQRKAPFVVSDFVPLAAQFREPEVLFVRASSSPRTVEELIALARTQAEGMSVAVPVTGVAENLAASDFQKKASLKLRTTAFVDGMGVLTATVNGQVEAGFAGFGTVLPSARSGQTRMLAILDERRQAALPEVPTLKERGMDVVFYSTLGYAVPKGVSQEIADYLAWALYVALSDPAQQARMREAGLFLQLMDAQQYGKLLSADGDRVKQLTPPR